MTPSITATIDHLKSTRAPTGIQRACLTLTLALHREENSNYEIQPIYLSRYTTTFVCFPVELIEEILNRGGRHELEILKSIESWHEFGHFNFVFGKGYDIAEADFSPDDIVLYPDVIWGPYFRNIWMIHNLTEAKIVNVVHDMIVVKDKSENAAKKYNSAFQKSIEFVLEHADLILVPSNATRIDVLRYAQQKRVQCFLRTIGWGVGDLSGFDNAVWGDLPVCLRNGQRFFLSVGTLSKRKNFVRTAEAFLAARHELPDDLVLIFCGKWDPELPDYGDLQSILERSEGKVVHLGQVSDLTLRLLYQKCCALLLLSTDEGWGLPVSEAMTFRRPLLLSDCGSLPEVAGNVAHYADPYSIDDISSKMKLIFSPGEGQRLHEEYGRLPDRSWSVVSKAVYVALEGLSE